MVAALCRVERALQPLLQVTTVRAAESRSGAALSKGCGAASAPRSHLACACLLPGRALLLLRLSLLAVLCLGTPATELACPGPRPGPRSVAVS